MESDIKRMDIKEFREKGYLLEANRRFFHPLGLALEIIIDDDGTERLGGIWDYRDDEEGMLFDESITADMEMRKKSVEITHELKSKIATRKELFGFGIQPFRRKKKEVTEVPPED